MDKITIAFDIEALCREGKGQPNEDQTSLGAGDNLETNDPMDPGNSVFKEPEPANPETFEVVIPSCLKRVGMKMRHVIHGSWQPSQRKPDPSLVRTIALAHRYKSMLMEANGRSISELAEECGVTSSYFSRVVRLAIFVAGHRNRYSGRA